MACYGFLQALYIQQDAIASIWKALGLNGDALSDPEVRRIRELRNRIAGHPARAEKLPRPSSAIINLRDIDPLGGFKAVIYYDDAVDEVELSFSSLLAENCRGLTGSLLAAEAELDRQEREFRAAESSSSLSEKFEAGLTYTLEKLRCSPGDSRRTMALNLLEGSLADLEPMLRARGYWNEEFEYRSSAIRAGINLGRHLDDLPAPEHSRQNWWVLCEGLDSHSRSILRHLHALDEELAETIV